MTASCFLINEFVVTGRETFACTFEESAPCLLTDDYTSSKEIWDIVDGRGIVADNTLNSGL